jgi:diguanylate cyclase (GGDEF)-like protein
MANTLKKYWIIAAIGLLLVVGFASTLLTSYLVAYRSLDEEIRRHTLPLTSDNVYSEIQKDLALSIFISSLMAHDTFVRDWVLAGEQNAGEIVKFLAEIRAKYHTVTAFFVSDRTGNYYHPEGILKRVGAEDPRDAWYFRARGLKDDYEINIDTDTADRRRVTIFINYKVFGYHNELIGVTGVGLELKQVQKILNAYERKYHSSVLFVDKTGKVVLHADDFAFPKDIHQWEGFAEAAVNILANPGASFKYETDGHVYYVSSRFFPEFKMTLVILKQGDTFRDAFVRRLRINLAIGIVITVLVVLAVSLILRGYNRRLEKLASIDSLTGAYNRHAFALLFSQAVKAKQRARAGLALLILDIDHFKSINDRYGHECGDMVLKQFAETVVQKIRQSDVFCRWGGEEFVILLVDCGIEHARRITENLRQAVSAHKIPCGPDAVAITLSAGVVEHRDPETLHELVVRADRLMYQAKAEGRDRVCCES